MLGGSQLFHGLETEKTQHNFFVKHFNLIDPIEVHLGTRRVWKIVKKEAVVVEKVFKGYYVPFVQSLSALLSLPEVQRELTRGHLSNDGIIEDFCDGAYVRNDDVLSQPNSLHILAYHDDMEIVNPIGAHVKTHKISIFYWILLNIRPQFRSRLPVIQLIGVAKSQDLRTFGHQPLLDDFIKGVSALSGQGLEVSVSGQSVKYQGGLVAFSADTPAANYVAGFKEGVGFAQRKCRSCDITDVELGSIFFSEETRKRTLAEHKIRCDEILDPTLSKKTKQYWSKEYGINYRSCLMEIGHFDVCQCFLHDPMHVLLEGIVHTEVRLLLQHLILNQKFLTLKQLNNRLDTHTFSVSDTNKPGHIVLKTLTSEQNCKLKMTAAEMHTFAAHLPLMIGEFIPEDDIKWVNFVRLLQILQIASAPQISEDTIQTLKHLVACHNMTFIHQYPEQSYTPKLHYMIHFPEQLRMFGPLRHHSCMRFEGKNGYFKSLKWKCFKNLPKSLAFRHQSWMCRQQTGSSGYKSHNYLYQGDIVREGTSIDIAQHSLSHVLMDQIAQDAEEVMISPEVFIHGACYKPGCLVLLNESINAPIHFGKVTEIIIVNDSKFFIIQEMDIIQFNYHYNAYSVRETQKVRLVNVLNLSYPWPIFTKRVNNEDLTMIKGYGSIEYPV